MPSHQVGESVTTKWDQWNESGKQMVVQGEVVSVKRSHHEMVYGVRMDDTNEVETVRQDQIS